jgi:1,4-alpha-glucan branching enzyme
MIKRRKITGSTDIKVSFVLDDEDPRLPASVVGDFNDWVAGADPFVRRGNGTASAVVSLHPGRSYRFRYRSDDGTWFNEVAADGYEPNVHGSTDCVVVG